MSRKRRASLTSDVLAGALAGAAATWLMDKVTTAMYEDESRKVQRRENKARGGKAAYEIAAQEAGSLLGMKLSTDQMKKGGAAVHWAVGVSSGAFYGILRNQASSFGPGSGIAYGLTIWLLMDEAVLTLLKLTPPPQKFPWQTHFRGAVGHIVLGSMIEATFEGIDRAAGG